MENKLIRVLHLGGSSRSILWLEAACIYVGEWNFTSLGSGGRSPMVCLKGPQNPRHAQEN
jgi:hypothetical protein